MNIEKIKRPIWITWESQRRNRELSRQLGALICEWAYIDRIKNTLVKYGTGIIITIRTLLVNKPKLVYCQNPSLILSLVVTLLGRIFGFYVVVDAHNAGVFPMEGRSSILMQVCKIIERNALCTIVTNQALAKHIERNGGRAFVLQDPLPEFHEVQGIELPKSFNILFICTFAEDEPYEQVFEAARKLPESVQIYVTGNYLKKRIDPNSMPANIKLLGFVPEAEFVGMLNAVDLTIDLTYRENCLVCGAYESVAAEKPMLLSNTAALRRYFKMGAMYTDNAASSIAENIVDAMQQYDRLQKDIILLKHDISDEWQHTKDEFLMMLERLKTQHSKKRRS